MNVNIKPCRDLSILPQRKRFAIADGVAVTFGV